MRPSWEVLCVCPYNFLCFFFSAGLIGFLFMLRALVAANFNTIYIYTAEVSIGEWRGCMGRARRAFSLCVSDC